MCIRLDIRATPFECSSMFVKNLDFLCRQELGKTACNRPDARATSSGCGLNKETREACYGKVGAQFCPDTFCLRLNAALRKSNQCRVRSSKAYK
jgi:hypothetical protein